MGNVTQRVYTTYNIAAHLRGIGIQLARIRAVASVVIAHSDGIRRRVIVRKMRDTESRKRIVAVKGTEEIGRKSGGNADRIARNFLRRVASAKASLPRTPT